MARKSEPFGMGRGYYGYYTFYVYICLCVCDVARLLVHFRTKLAAIWHRVRHSIYQRNCLLFFFAQCFELIARTVRDFGSLSKASKKKNESATDLLSSECQITAFITIYCNFIC